MLIFCKLMVHNRSMMIDIIPSLMLHVMAANDHRTCQLDHAAPPALPAVGAQGAVA